MRPTARPSAGLLLAGAGSRLLPASIPLRFFGAAATFHLLAWLALLAGSATLPRFAGGLGWTLAGLHLATLGVLAMTAIGASLQLLPVATRQPVGATRLPALLWWLYTPGVAALAIGMGTGASWLLGAGAVAAVSGLAVFAALLARNLAGARGMPAVVAHGWVALAALLATLATGVSLVLANAGLPAPDRGTALALHVALSAYGFMGMLALGLSYILVPMFALSPAPAARPALVSCGLAALALGLAAAAALAPTTAAAALRAGATLAAAVAIAIHLRLMLRALREGMRRELGRSFTMVRVSWALLAASVPAGLAVALDLPLEGAPTLFGLLLVGGWLLGFLFGILQRILPFLASMHKPPGGGPPRTPSSLTDDRPLAVHFWCHFAALGLLGLAVVLDSPPIAAAAAAVGAVGACAFAAFFAVVVLRMRRPPPTRPLIRPLDPGQGASGRRD
ncbi:hypothetical protein M6I34_00805 [Burkholderiaceae bacterium FT117]|uniref:hypothetical protein n=1 Tax=Zeimonas sediminis TaxID=2944268 RepID=UPI002342CD43|nr:hypothetical protein [Zeimonas sediminis]MCM5569040.1 hypothetical protein [Zeimonas sediminis]